MFFLFYIVKYLGQLVVTTFLFYSGYGTIKSIKTKKYYLNNIPKKVIHLWIKFSFVIFIFLLLNIYLDNHYTHFEIILSFVGWESIGNSNWYIFCILLLYIFTYIGFSVTKNNKKSLLILIVLVVILMNILFIFKHEHHWFNTLPCYVVGCIYYFIQKKIEKYLSEKKHYYLVILIISIMFILSYIAYAKINSFIYFVSAILFVLLIVILSMRIKINNRVLLFFGKHSFEIYILQRIPMILFNWLKDCVMLYFILVFVITIIMSIWMKRMSCYCHKTKY